MPQSSYWFEIITETCQLIFKHMLLLFITIYLIKHKQIINQRNKQK